MVESQFQVDPGYSSAPQGNCEALPAHDLRPPAQSWQFVGEFQRLLGENCEPDPQFFVDSWTRGTGAAVESFRQRRQAQAESERPASQGTDHLDTRGMLRESALCADFVSSSAAAANRESRSITAPPPSYQDDSVWADRRPPRDWSTSAEECVLQQASQPMTLERACQLLGVTPMSTQKQVKAAYRRMVSQWHPDHLELETADARQYATERMAAINEAYSLMRGTQLH